LISLLAIRVGILTRSRRSGRSGGSRRGSGAGTTGWVDSDGNTDAVADALKDGDDLGLVGGRASLLDAWGDAGAQLVGSLARAGEVGGLAANGADTGEDALQRAGWEIGDALSRGESGEESADSDVGLHFCCCFGIDGYYVRRGVRWRKLLTTYKQRRNECGCVGCNE
jgi:hypothetical protein